MDREEMIDELIEKLSEELNELSNGQLASLLSVSENNSLLADVVDSLDDELDEKEDEDLDDEPELSTIDPDDWDSYADDEDE